jgi:muconate cycloisomerase
MVNVRISKCGGLLGALRVIETARKRGLAVQLGAQVGESCILSAAGALLAAGTPGFRWREGCFGTHLLREDLCKDEFRFGIRGEMVPPSGPGLGVRVDGTRLGASG